MTTMLHLHSLYNTASPPPDAEHCEALAYWTDQAVGSIGVCVGVGRGSWGNNWSGFSRHIQCFVITARYACGGERVELIGALHHLLPPVT